MDYIECLFRTAKVGSGCVAEGDGDLLRGAEGLAILARLDLVWADRQVREAIVAIGVSGHRAREAGLRTGHGDHGAGRGASDHRAVGVARVGSGGCEHGQAQAHGHAECGLAQGAVVVAHFEFPLRLMVSACACGGLRISGWLDAPAT